MRLDDLDPSRNVRDHGRGGGGGGSAGGIPGLLFTLLPMLIGRKMGCGTLLLLGIAGYFLFSSGGLNMADMVAYDNEGVGVAGNNVACDTADELFACRVLKSTEDSWAAMIPGYRPATLHFYRQSGQSGCGMANAATGPFYCPSDQGIYLDTDFFDQLERQFGAGGDFARAYVIAHEVGHHVQNLTGTAARVRRAQSQSDQATGNALQVAMELQADCYAGVWAAQNADRIEPGDVEEGMRAAHAIGDDTLMRNAGRTPIESMFTHGTSAQRMEWLRRGLENGDPALCDSFGA